MPHSEVPAPSPDLAQVRKNSIFASLSSYLSIFPSWQREDAVKSTADVLREIHRNHVQLAEQKVIVSIVVQVRSVTLLNIDTAAKGGGRYGSA